MQQYDWSQELQGYILSAFYVGNGVANLPLGCMAARVGGQPVLLLATFASAILSLSTPFAVVYGGPIALMFVQFLLGATQAGLFPAVITLLAAWVPICERGRVASIVFCAAPVRLLNVVFLDLCRVQ